MIKMDEKPDKTVDCIGLFCPMPLLRTREEIDSLQSGQVLELIADDPAAEEDIKSFAKRTGNEILSIKKEGDKLRIFIKKT
ncbi:MAG: sulfurtransferase TusA family protein [Halobacteriota archaeon]|nr:sulfurtransferase TusA family protein [Halobacteriota archaeon]